MTCEFSFRDLVVSAIDPLHNRSRASRGEPDHNEKTGGKTAGTLISGDFLDNIIDDLKRFLGKKVRQGSHKCFFRKGSETTKGSQQIKKWK